MKTLSLAILTNITFFAFIICSAPALSSVLDYSRVINLSGKQRMLTQKMSKEAVLIALDVDTENNLKNLQQTRDLFDKTLKGLRNGDADLGLPATKTAKIIGALDEVDNLWLDFDKAVTQIITNSEVSDNDIKTIADNNVELLKAMNKCVKLYEAAASGGDMNPALAIAINLSGRQRMLTQKMSKEYFMIAKGYEVDSYKANLTETIALFDTTLTGLIEGDVDTGLSPAPTDEITEQLKKVQGLWITFKEKIETQPTPENISSIAADNIILLQEMDKSVKMFEKLGQ